MRIVELIAHHVRIPLRKRITHASHSRQENDTLVVCCRLDDGTAGWGEGLPRPYVTGETIETALEHLKQTDWAAQLGGPVDSLTAAVALCESFRLADLHRGQHGDQQRDCFGNAARCAVELSVLDAAARAEGVPLSAVTAMIPETMGIRETHGRVRYSGAITTMSPLKEVVRALKFRVYGFHQCKVKVGAAGRDDAASLARIRRVIGKNVDLRLDANEAWTCGNLEAKLEPLLPYGVTSLEQPVPHADVDGLAEVRGRIDVPIMLDESLCSLSDGHRAIERATCDLFNIRLSKCGGYINSLRLAALADRFGLGYQLGCQVGETGILSAAGRHFASSVRNIRYLEGSFDRFLVREPLTAQDLTFGRGGYAPALGGPGLGVEIDRDAVERVTVSQQHHQITAAASHTPA